MAQLTREDIDKVAYLSRLELSEEEKDKLTTHINRLLESFQELQALDTDDVEPTSHTIPVANVFRKDEARPSLKPEDVIFIPVCVPQAAIAGNVRRPAIYELKGAATVDGLIALAGGMTPTGSVEWMQLRRVE